MPGVKEICGLIFALCYVSAKPVSDKEFLSQNCSKLLESGARKLFERYNISHKEKALKNAEIRTAAQFTGLPSCESPKPWTLDNTYNVVMGFNQLFEKKFHSYELTDVLRLQNSCFAYRRASASTPAPITYQPRNVTSGNSEDVDRMSFYYVIQYYNKCLTNLTVSSI